MLVDGRDVRISGSLLQPLTRRTNDILRVALSGALLAAVITSSLVTRTRWDSLEMSISRIIGVLTPTQSDVVYLVYGLAVLALPFMILFGLILARQWRLLIPYAAAALIAVLGLSITGTGIAAPQWHFDLNDRLRTVLSQFLDDPRWIGMLAAVLTVSGPWLPARWRHWWWTLLLAFIPIHLFVSAIVPARSLLGLAVGWFVGALVILVSGTPALEVPLDGAVRAMAKRGFVVTGLRVVRPAGSGPLILAAVTEEPEENAVVEMYGPHQRSGGALRQVWRILRLRENETAPLQASMRRAVEHRALMAIAIGDLGIANTETIAVGLLDRGWTFYAHKRIRGEPLKRCHASTPVAEVWESLRKLQEHQISHGDLRDKEITVSNGAVFFGGFGSAEYGATDNQLQADIAQLLVTTIGALRRGRGRRCGDRGARARRRADRVTPAHQNCCAETYSGLGRRSEGGHLPKPCGGHAPNRHREDQTRVGHPVQPQPARPDGAARRAGLRRLPVHQHGADVLQRA